MDHIFTIAAQLASIYSDLSNISVDAGRICLSVLLMPMAWRALRTT